MCHGFQITYFMSQQFPIALIIEFVETLNQEVKENTYAYFYYCYHGPRYSHPSDLMIYIILILKLTQLHLVHDHLFLNNNTIE